MEEILSKIMNQNVRWLRKNFFIGKLKLAFSVSTLIDPDKTKREKLLEECYNDLSVLGKEELAEKVWADPEYKQNIILFLVQPQDLRNQEFCNNVIRCNPKFKLIKTVDLLQEPSKIIEDIEQDRKKTVVGVTALFYLFENAVSKINDIESIITFMVGCVGKKYTIVIYEEPNTDIKTFADSIGIACEWSKNLAING